MTATNSSNSLKVIAGLLGAALVGTLIYTISLYNDKKQTTAKLNEEKDLVIEDLNNLKSDYDKAIANNEETSGELEEARDKIASYIDSVKTMKADISALYRYRRQVNQLRKEREYLLAQNDSLKKSNEMIAMQRDSTIVALEEQTTFTDSLVVQNTQLAKIVEAGSALNLNKFNVDAVRERNSGKLVSTNRNNRADKIKLCYTVGDNKISNPGPKQFYIQVTDPSGNIMGEKAIAANEEEGTNITYTKASSFYYENTALDVCEFVSKEGSEFPEGTYTAKVFDDKLRELGTSTFTLK
ncbi:hypothetical protein SAMN04487906_2460 [Zhouia amylolytica]|uniref:Uncharacterized protein n=2 Tax=Zhouia amylolytica TaxID=376730 RepID=W2UPY2_9FLAO|nr:hypothetical protein [Zhouia amylolytica]ETN95362.1 hypothetical protein P278_10840 [Zhouia amylolytica AD3]MCQ0112822.1 hypothetical protein [Zhouia amylolytica]SFT00578.1 hypothetical protein SAMN04487906_2460 [Zhouia amylolytica]